MITWIFLGVLFVGYCRDLTDPAENKRRDRKARRWRRGENKYPQKLR